MNPELELARELLEDARLLSAQARHRSTVSRAYYAAYHACIALMEGFGLRPGNYLGRGGWPASRWEHGIITATMAADPRLSGILTRSVALRLRWLYLQRIRGDYRAHEAISTPAARTSVMLAEQVVSVVGEYLDA